MSAFEQRYECPQLVEIGRIGGNVRGAGKGAEGQARSSRFALTAAMSASSSSSPPWSRADKALPSGVSGSMSKTTLMSHVLTSMLWDGPPRHQRRRARLPLATAAELHAQAGGRAHHQLDGVVSVRRNRCAATAFADEAAHSGPGDEVALVGGGGAWGA